MIAVLFELEPIASEADRYFALAGELKPTLETIDGSISVERFQSINNPDKYLSLSFWRDEEAVKAWRNLSAHRQAQRQGRVSIFRRYRIRVGAVIRDYGMNLDNQQCRHQQQ